MRSESPEVIISHTVNDSVPEYSPHLLVHLLIHTNFLVARNREPVCAPNVAQASRLRTSIATGTVTLHYPAIPIVGVGKCAVVKYSVLIFSVQLVV